MEKKETSKGLSQVPLNATGGVCALVCKWKDFSSSYSFFKDFPEQGEKSNLDRKFRVNENWFVGACKINFSC